MAKKASELAGTDDVVVKLGKKTDFRNGKTVTVEESRNVVMTKAGFDAIERDEDGHAVTIGRTVELAGTPKYGDEIDTIGGKMKELKGFDKLTAEKEEKVSDPA